MTPSKIASLRSELDDCIDAGGGGTAARIADRAIALLESSQAQASVPVGESQGDIRAIAAELLADTAAGNRVLAEYGYVKAPPPSGPELREAAETALTALEAVKPYLDLIAREERKRDDRPSRVMALVLTAIAMLKPRLSAPPSQQPSDKEKV